MTPGDHVRAGRGEVAAVVMAASGQRITYRELDERSMRLARRLRAHGLGPGGHVAVMLENHPRWFEVFWATMRSGLYFAPINWHLDAAECSAMVEHSDATALVTSAALADVARSLGARRLADVTLRLVMDGELAGYASYEAAIAAHSPEPLADERQGEVMFYSSGTTGRPRSLEPPLTGAAFGERPNVLAALMQAQWGFGPDTVFLCAGPMYHAAPTGFTACVQRLGGTVVLMESFDARRALELIEEHEVTHALFVPTHLLRLLEVPEAERGRHDLSSLRAVIHGAGPCPVEAKEQLIDWFGKIVHEYYVGAEGNAFTLVTPDDWLEHKGTVGKPLAGAIHVLDDGGTELPSGSTGVVWFETGAQFEYHDDAEATRTAHNERGWSTLGDLGFLDEGGFLHITGRVAHQLTSDGLTFSPEEVEHLLVLHPAVTDVALVGGGDDPLTALVQVAPGIAADETLSAILLAHCRAQLEEPKRPSVIEYVDALPRLPSGKLLRRALPARYRA